MSQDENLEGPPCAERGGTMLMIASWAAIAAAAGFFFVATECFTTRTRGASVSSRLQWRAVQQERRQEIERAAAAAKVEEGAGHEEPAGGN